MSKRPQNHAEFLAAIFHAAAEAETGCIAATHVSEGKATYPAYPWPTYKPQEFHTHYGVGLHLPSDPKIKDRSKFRRTKATWQGLAVIVLDDIGEKKDGIEIGTPDLEPSFIVQTKPTSQQWGYILAEPLRDYGRACTILNATLLAGLNDPGGQNPSRLARLPGSQPHGKKHKAEMVAWTGRHFTAEEVVEGLGLDLVAARSVGKAMSKAPLTDGDPEPVEVGDDPVIAWMEGQGMILGNGAAEGWIDIVCPWHEEHTDGDTCGTGYRPPMDNDPYRSFHCFHRCSGVEYGRDTNKFLEWVRKSGGPDVEPLDEVAREKRRKDARSKRATAMAGGSDPILLEHVAAAKASTSPEERQRHANSIIWLLCDDGWGDAEIIRLLVSCRITGPDISATVRWFVDQIEGIRSKQASYARRDAERQVRRAPTATERLERAMSALSRLEIKEQKAIAKWLGEKING